MKKMYNYSNIRGAVRNFLKRISFLTLSVLAFFLIGHYISLNTEYEYTDTEKTSGTGKNVVESSEQLYTLMLENERLAVYSEDGSCKYVDADTELFTEYDKALLAQGITGDIDEIRDIIEGLMS